MLIIVEGSDRSGKSVLVHAIHDQIKERYPEDLVTLHHAGPPKKHPLNEYEQPLFTYHPGQQLHVICDRWHLGEVVYPKIFNRHSELTPAMLSHIEAFLRARGAILVHVWAHSTVLRHRFEDEVRKCPTCSLVSWKQLKRSHDSMAIAVEQSTLQCLHVNTSSSSCVNEHAATIVSTADDAERAVIGIADLRTYTGGPTPSLLLVGDVRYGHRHLHTNATVLSQAQLDPSPAFMPYSATSGAYLLDVINTLMKHRDVGFVNANDVDDPRVVWKSLGEPTTVALGRNAFKATSEWVTGAVPHPQFIRRFYYAHKTWYNELIQRAATGQNLLDVRPET